METVWYNVEQKSNIYAAFLDIKGAFDTVWHDGMFLKLGELGVTGKVWRIIKDSYTDLKCNVRLNGICSGPVPVQRGVRQGGYPLFSISHI